MVGCRLECCIASGPPDQGARRMVIFAFDRNLEHLLRFLMALSLLTVAAASTNNFRFVTRAYL